MYRGYTPLTTGQAYEETYKCVALPKASSSSRAAVALNPGSVCKLCRPAMQSLGLEGLGFRVWGLGFGV